MLLPPTGNNDLKRNNLVGADPTNVVTKNNAAAASAAAAAVAAAAAAGTTASSVAAAAALMESSCHVSQPPLSQQQPVMNNGGKDTSNSDVQRLPEQLNDIKEQVRFYVYFMNTFNLRRAEAKFCTPLSF